MAEFLRLKRRHDPGEVFQSDWYRHYKQMFADRPVRARFSGICRRKTSQPRRGLGMRRLVRSFALLIAVLALGGCDALIARFILPRKASARRNTRVATERDANMTTSDGVTLVADIHRPKMSGPAPTILVRIPFSRTFRNTSFGPTPSAGFWASRGYTVVVQGTRGRYNSGGAFYPLRHERQDGIETLQWLARQPWFDGRLGMWGGSVFGHTQWALADQSRPGPTALMIQIASTSFREMFHAGGAFALESALFWAARSGGPVDVDPSSTRWNAGSRDFR